jgi:uncharacterized protein YcnI
MRVTSRILGVANVLGILAVAAAAQAHISVASGSAVANASQEVVFGVGHGCTGVDTYRVKIDIPAGVTSVRTETSDFGPATIEKNSAGDTVSVTWQKPLANLLPEDTAYYKLVLRLKSPDKPFSTVYFPAHQTCRAPNGTLTVVSWIGLPSATPVPDGGTAPEPAPALNLVPAHFAGWNKYAVPSDLADLSVFFKDALIVWKGNQAYSANPATAALITSTAGVTALGSSSLRADDEIWVKY